MKYNYAAFTDRGEKLAQYLSSRFEGEITSQWKRGTLREWTERNFQPGNALIFVGAAGIAVRAIAPYVKSKLEDPAVIVVEETGKFVIPILSGHLGGANETARRMASFLGAIPVITTATDNRGVFAVDNWAKALHCIISHPEHVKTVSKRLLEGETVSFYSAWPVAGTVPAGILMTPKEKDPQVILDVTEAPAESLSLIPPIGVLGIGCRKGITWDRLEETLDALKQETGLSEKAIRKVTTIDIKEKERGLLSFCAGHGWPMTVYSAEKLREVKGDFTTSPFVEQAVGVDNVCERAAVRCSKGTLWQKKFVGRGVTMAVALEPFVPAWSLGNE